MTLADAFDAHMSDWKEWQEAPWGRLRYTIAQTNLRRHLPPRPLRILDVAGGNGLDAFPLAAAGHTITLVDFSAGMLAEARHNADIYGVAERMAFHHADYKALPDLFPEPTFDVLLCHNLLQYVDDVADALRIICQPLQPDGLISIIASNRYSEPYRVALQQLDPAAALTALDATSVITPTFNLPARWYTGEEIIPLLQEAGCMLLGHYGVRCINDYIASNDLKADPVFFAQLEQLELAMTDKYPYYLLGRFFQLIACKSAG